MAKTVVMKKVVSIAIILTFICSGVILVLLPSPLIIPATAASNWTTTTDDDFVNGTYNNTTMVGTGENAVIQIDMSEVNHWTKITSHINPGSRWGHGIATIYGTTEVVLYGAWSLTDTWAFNASNNTWVDKKPPNNPGNKQSHGMASFYGTDKILIFSDDYRSDHTWMYDFSDNNWTRKFPSTNPIGRRDCAISSVFNEDKVVMFGGQGFNYNDYTWIFDLSVDNWTRKITSSYPSRRQYHAMAPILGTDKVLLFGGTSWSYLPLNDTWIYDVSENKWTQMYPKNNPSPKLMHALAPIWGTDKIVLSAGRPSGTAYSDETWVYDYSDNNWKESKSWNQSNNPGARAGHAMAYVDGIDEAVLFGGFGPDTDTSTWIYKHFLTLKNGTYTSAPNNTGANSSFQTISWVADVPVDTNLKFQFRTASTKNGLNEKDFVGPDGTSATFYVSSPANIWPGHYGDQWAQYISYFNMDTFTDSPKIKDVVISYNCIPCCRIIDPFDGCLISNNKPTFKWSFEDFDSKYQEGFQILIDDNINFTEVDYDSGWQITENEYWEFPSGTSYSSIPDGTWYWTIRTMDADGAWSDYSTPRVLKIDTIAPTSATTFPINNGFYRDVDKITGIASEQIVFTGLMKVEIAIKRLIDNNFWNGSAWIPLASWLLADGTDEWSYDSSSIQWTSGLRYTIQSRATDFALNIETPEIQNLFYIDTEYPESTIEYPIDNTWINKLNSVSGTAVDFGGSDVGKVEICIRCTRDSEMFDEGAKENQCWNGKDWTNAEAWLTTTGTNEWKYNSSSIPFKTGDHYVIHSRAVDNTENLELPGSGTIFLYDDSPPDPVSIFINNGEEFTRIKLATLSLTAEDIGSGVAKMAFRVNGGVWSAWEPFNTTRTIDIESGDGEKTIYFKVKDYSGNIADVVQDEIFMDTTPPHGLSIVINDGEEITGSKQVRLDFQATDLGSGVSVITYSFDGYNWVPWEEYKSTKYISLGTVEGKRHIFYKARDKVGNTADPASDSIILDTTPPYSLFIKINDGAAETNSTTVALDLRALDNISGVSQIAFSLDGETWTEWEEYTKSKSMELPVGNGIKTIYYKVKDKVGNEAKPVSATILMNITTLDSDTDISQTSTGLEFWIYIIIIVIIAILILIISALIFVIRKKKRAEPELVSAGALTIRPQRSVGPLPSVQQVQPTTQYPQLAGTPTVNTSPIPTVTQAPAPVPVLVKSTQTIQPTVVQGPVPQPQVVPQPVPQLPPANVQAQAQQPCIAPQPTLATTPTVTQPTVTQPAPQPQPTVAPTPTIAQPQPQLEELEPVNGPEVHLPDTTQQPKQTQSPQEPQKPRTEDE